MESNNIITAPQILNVNGIYNVWSKTHEGGWWSFYEFMTTPSAEREAFIASVGLSVGFDGSVLLVTLKPL